MERDFEKWLTEKKNKLISGRTLRDCKSTFIDCLEGRRLSSKLLKQLEKKTIICNSGKERSTSWTRQILRYYVRYLYTSGQLGWDDYSRLLIAVPGRKYGHKSAQKLVRVTIYSEPSRLWKRADSTYTPHTYSYYPVEYVLSTIEHAEDLEPR